LLHGQRADFTLAFRHLASVGRDPAAFLALFADPAPAREFLERYQARLQADTRAEPERRAAMLRANPLYGLRNHLAQGAIAAAAQGDVAEIATLLALLRDPYTERTGFERYAAAAPEWAERLEVSCSS